MNTGSILKGRPSMGSWLLYGLGAETDDLPGFIVLISQGKAAARSRSRPGSGRPGSCPASSRASSSSRGATPSTTSATPTASARAPSGRSSRRSTGSTACSPRSGSTPRSQTRIAQYEMAFRMQTSRARADRLRAASRSDVLDLYGVKQPGDGSFASNCLLARRLAERGRAVHPALPPRLGPPRRHRARTCRSPRRRSTRPAPRWSRT